MTVPSTASSARPRRTEQVEEEGGKRKKDRELHINSAKEKEANLKSQFLRKHAAWRGGIVSALLVVYFCESAFVLWEGTLSVAAAGFTLLVFLLVLSQRMPSTAGSKKISFDTMSVWQE